MPKCPHCKQEVTLEKTRRQSADASIAEGVQREVSGILPLWRTGAWLCLMSPQAPTVRKCGGPLRTFGAFGGLGL
jgi:hypothetical protein